MEGAEFSLRLTATNAADLRDAVRQGLLFSSCQGGLPGPGHPRLLGEGATLDLLTPKIGTLKAAVI
jgi:hypothetical protein